MRLSLPQLRVDGAFFKWNNRHNQDLDRLWRNALSEAEHARRRGRVPTFSREGPFRDVRALHLPHRAPLEVMETTIAELLMCEAYTRSSAWRQTAHAAACL